MAHQRSRRDKLAVSRPSKANVTKVNLNILLGVTCKDYAVATVAKVALIELVTMPYDAKLFTFSSHRRLMTIVSLA